MPFLKKKKFPKISKKLIPKYNQIIVDEFHNLIRRERFASKEYSLIDLIAFANMIHRFNFGCQEMINTYSPFKEGEIELICKELCPYFKVCQNEGSIFFRKKLLQLIKQKFGPGRSDEDKRKFFIELRIRCIRNRRKVSKLQEKEIFE